MKIPFRALAMLAFIAWGACCRSFAEEPMLFRASGFLTPASEASVLTEREKKMIAIRRADRFTKAVLIARVDTSVLQSPVISLEMPDHTVYRFRGSAKEVPNSPGYAMWTGMPLGETVPRPSDLQLMIRRGGEYVEGRLYAATGMVLLQTVNGKYMLLQESGLNPASPPIDAEPPNPLQSRPARSGRDWPPGLLSDKLKSSIATSSIGADLSPESCDQVTSCGAVTRFSCHPERDGAETFFDNTTGILIMACGGYCMRGAGLPGSKLCTACPPPEWNSCGGKSATQQQR